MNLSEPLSVILPGLDGPILRTLSRTTLPLTGSRIAELVENSKTGVRKALNRFVNQGTVLVHKAGPSLLYQANREHLAWPAIEAAVHAADSILVELEARIIAELGAHLNPVDAVRCTVALFGSVARGTSTLHSDIDLLLLFPDSVNADEAELLVDSLAQHVPKWTGNACNVLELDHLRLLAMKNANDPMIGSLLSDARTIFGPNLQRMMAEL